MSCYGCGYKNSYPMTKINGHKYHVGCAEQKAIADKKTKELLKDCSKLAAIFHTS